MRKHLRKIKRIVLLVPAKRTTRNLGMLFNSPVKLFMKSWMIWQCRKPLWPLPISQIWWLAQKLLQFRNKNFWKLPKITSVRENMLQLLWQYQKINLWSTKLIYVLTLKLKESLQTSRLWLMSHSKIFRLCPIFYLNTAIKFKWDSPRLHRLSFTDLWLPSWFWLLIWLSLVSQESYLILISSTTRSCL